MTRSSSAASSSSRAVLTVLFFGVLMAALDIAMVGPALGAIRETLGIGERSTAWIFNTFVLFNLLGLPLMAGASDAWGRRTVYMVDLALFAAGSGLVAAAPSFEAMLVGRALQGLGASGIFPVASAVVGDTYAPERRGRALGLLGAVFGLAFIVGPILAGILLQFGWRWIFLINLPLALGVAAFAWRILPAGGAAQRRRLDVTGIAVLGLLLAALSLGITRIETDAFGQSLLSGRVWPLLLTAGLLVPVFVRVERRAAAPLLRLGLFSSRQVVLAALLAMGAGLTEAAFIFFPALASAAFDVSRSAASFMLLPLTFAVALGSPLMGRLVDRLGTRSVVLACTALMAAGLGTMGVWGDVRWAFYAGSVLIGLGLAGLLGSALSYILLAESDASERTVAQGVITLAISIGQLLGGATIGAFAASVGREGAAEGFMAAFRAIAVVALVLTVLALGLKNRAAERATPTKRTQA